MEIFFVVIVAIPILALLHYIIFDRLGISFYHVS